MILFCSKFKISKHLRILNGILLISVLSYSINATSQTKNTIQFNQNRLQNDNAFNNFKWKYKIFSEQNSSELENSLLLNTHFDLNYSSKINSNLEVYISPSVIFESGQVSSYKSEKASDSALELKTAYIDLSAASISSKIGLLQPKNYVSDQIFSSKNLIAMNLQYTNSGFSIQQLISVLPSSVNNLKTSESNKKSTLSLSQVQWDYQVSEFTSTIHTGYFSFNELNSGVADDASSTGNSITLKNNVENLFAYKYSGLFLDMKIDLLLTEKWKTGFRYSSVKNEKAPEGLNTGHSLTFNNSLIHKKINITLQNNIFRVEPDAIVSSMTNPYLFQNNKIGYSHGLWIQPLQQNMKVGFGSGEQQLLYQNSLQSAETFYWISMESEYANF